MVEKLFFVFPLKVASLAPLKSPTHPLKQNYVWIKIIVLQFIFRSVFTIVFIYLITPYSLFNYV